MSNAFTPLSFTVLSDLHYYPSSSGVSGSAYEKANQKSAQLLATSADVLETAFKQVAKDDFSDIVLISGDVTRNGEIDAHKGFITLLRQLKSAGKRVYVITATHDYQEEAHTTGYEGDHTIHVPAALREELYDMYYEFGPNEAIAIHQKSMSYVVQLADGYRLFALNDDQDGSGRSGFSEECFSWILEQAEDAKQNGQNIVAMTHHPWISPSPFYSIIGKNDLMGGHEARRETFADIGIPFLFTGHTHIQDISYHFSKNKHVFYDISTPSMVGYPGTMRKATLDAEHQMLHIATAYLTEPVTFPCRGGNLQTELFTQFFGMIEDILTAAGTDVKQFAQSASSLFSRSLSYHTAYRIGWLIKPVAKWLNNLTIGTIARWTKAETGLKAEAYADINDRSVIQFIVSLVMHLYGGDSPYTPNTNQYKITIGFLNILDSFLSAIHLSIGKFVKGADSVRSLVEPLLYNDGICDAEASLPLQATPEEVAAICPSPVEETVKPSKKGVPLLLLLILFLLLFLPFLPIAAVLLLIGYLVNEMRYHKHMNEKTDS